MDLVPASFFTDDYDSHTNYKNHVLETLNNIVAKSDERIDENSFYYSRSFVVYTDLYIKQVNLYSCGKHASNKLCEIGFNAGHSALLFLLGRTKTPIDYTIFDIGTHTYTVPCLNYIKTAFPFATFEYVEGDSTSTMPSWIAAHPECIETYGLIHVDGGQTESCVKSDIHCADLLVKVNGIIIVNNTNISYINAQVDIYIASGKYTELSILPTKGCTHRVLQKVLGTNLVQSSA